MKPQLKLINAAFDKLSWIFDAKTTNWAEKLREQCLKEEKGHRGFVDGFARCHPGAASANQCAKMFAVLRVSQYLLGAKFPSGQDYLHTQTSCFIAAGIVDEFRDDIYKAWKDLEIREIVALDYLDLVGKAKEAV